MFTFYAFVLIGEHRPQHEELAISFDSCVIPMHVSHCCRATLGSLTIRTDLMII